MEKKKQCSVCDSSRQTSYGVAVSSLTELKTKACKNLHISSDPEAIMLVLDEDGTIVEDEDYFLCLPGNTKFMLLKEKEKWKPPQTVDGGTAWLMRESVTEDEVDIAVPLNWKDLAKQLKQDLANILLMSEADLQTLTDAPCDQLAAEMQENVCKTKKLQDTLQRVLDRKEEERQSRQILELYLEALKIENKKASVEWASGSSQDVVDSSIDSSGSSTLSCRLINVLKEKSSPELSLSNQELQVVVKENVDVLVSALKVEKQKALSLQQACEEELNHRLEQVKILHSLSSCSKGRKTEEDNVDVAQTKRKK
ncbi:DNA fragmentation factor subunit alpha isoform X1 [Protopterus annectens]|uniref:DNA fragmentation factor subunit alpha isoform X1 n=2 Tax=Protopterus annectens TaxID=7888 RepID=UPI001CFC257D|nr:DNA fragmentation factor subunit alpha isoform X1 [Protopterus annectens]